MVATEQIEQIEWLSPEKVAALQGVTDETVRLWIRRGLRVHGKRIRLRARRLGIRHQTCVKWVEEFIAACTAAANGAEPAPQVESESEQRKRFTADQEAVRQKLRGAR